MWKIIILALLFTNLAHEKQSDITALGWLVGTWQIEEAGSFEQWSWSADRSQLEGLGYRYVEGERIQSEGLKIVCDADGCAYIADVPSNDGPVRFAITEMGEKGFKASNPDHDFPTFIYYDLQDDGSLIATVGNDEFELELVMTRKE